MRQGLASGPSRASVQRSAKVSAESLPEISAWVSRILDVATAADIELDGQGRGLRARVEGGDVHSLCPRAAHHQAAASGRVPRVKQLVDRLGCGKPLERPIVAVDGLRPCLDGAPDRGLEDVGGKPGVGDREVERRRAGVAVEVEVGHLGDREVLGDLAGDRDFHQGLVAKPLGVRPRRGDDRIVEVVVALRVLLDR